jgi:small subunit ribosomal protein S18
MSDTINNETTEGQNPEVTAEPTAPAVETAQPTAPAAPAAPQPPQQFERSARPERPRGRGRFGDSSERGDRESGPSEGGMRMPRFKKKVCMFCQDKNAAADYKRPDILERFITDRGKILPRRVTGTCSKHQRMIAREIKRARSISLLPFVEQ